MYSKIRSSKYWDGLSSWIMLNRTFSGIPYLGSSVTSLVDHSHLITIPHLPQWYSVQDGNLTIRVARRQSDTQIHRMSDLCRYVLVLHAVILADELHSKTAKIYLHSSFSNNEVSQEIRIQLRRGAIHTALWSTRSGIYIWHSYLVLIERDAGVAVHPYTYAHDADES